jgi:hypothetical protein
LLLDVEPIVNSVKRDVCTWKVDDKRLVEQVAANWTNYMSTCSVHITWAAEEEEEKGWLVTPAASKVWREHKAKRGKAKVRWSYKVRQGDANYMVRTDTVGDWMEFDEDDSKQIEKHY